MPNKPRNAQGFGFEEGDILAGKYEVQSFLGSGWEGEVYRVRELDTDIERAAKSFFPVRNIHNRLIKFYARKLHRPRHCSILIQYHTKEIDHRNRESVTFLVSEYVEGKLLSALMNGQPGKRLTPFEGLHLLHALAAGVEEIHGAKEYHGDLHEDNVIVRRRGIEFDVKLVDMYNWGALKGQHMRDDVCDLIRLFYEAIGGARHYANQREEIKKICCGLKRSLITQKFRTAGHLRRYLEEFSWVRE